MPLIEPFQKHTFYSQVHIQAVLHFVVILYKLLSNKFKTIFKNLLIWQAS